jgi:hypothetical protein
LRGLQESGRGHAMDGRSGCASLVVAEMAMAVVLPTGAGLMIAASSP